MSQEPKAETGVEATPAATGKKDRVPIRLPSGEQAWVSADAFNLISEKEFHDSERLRRLRDQRNMALALAAVVTIVFAAAAVSFLTRPDLPTAAAEPDQANAVEGTDPPATAAPPEPRSDPVPSQSDPVPSRSDPVPSRSDPVPSGSDPEIEEVVQAWAQAWSARDAEAVLEFYSPSFLVPDGMRRATWEQLRRERIENPELLAVTVEDLVAERTGPESAVARFLQIYDTPGYRVWVMKTLQLASESDRWRIVDELASLAEVGSGAYPVELIQPTP